MKLKLLSKGVYIAINHVASVWNRFSNAHLKSFQHAALAGLCRASLPNEDLAGKGVQLVRNITP